MTDGLSLGSLKLKSFLLIYDISEVVPSQSLALLLPCNNLKLQGFADFRHPSLNETRIEYYISSILIQKKLLPSIIHSLNTGQLELGTTIVGKIGKMFK